MSESSLLLPTADRAFLLALRARGDVADADWTRLLPDHAARLSDDWEFLKTAGPSPERAAAILGDELRAQRRPDLNRAHPTWIERALRVESPAVRRILAARGSPPAASIAARFDDAPTDLDHEPDPEAVALALTLWSERLVGDVAEREDDPPVVPLLVVLGTSWGFRLAETIGLLKLSLLPRDRRPSLTRRETKRLDRLDGPKSSDALIALVEAELRESRNPGRRVAAALGLTTIGRLSRRVDPHRLRWALQHRPYPLAGLIRAAASGPSSRSDSVAVWDARLLRRAAASLSNRPDRPEILRNLA